MKTLVKFRGKAGLSQTELANRAGITVGRYNHYETGKRELPVAIAKEIGKVLKIDWWLIYEDE